MYHSKLLLAMLKFYFDHWIEEVISCKCKIGMFFHRPKYPLLYQFFFIVTEDNLIFKRWWNASNNYNSLSRNANRSTSCYHCVFLCHTSLWRVHVDIWEKTNKNNSSVGKLVMTFQIGSPNKCSKNTICTFRMFKNEFVLNENDWKMYSSLMHLEEEILICWPLPFWNMGLNKTVPLAST